MPRPATSSVSIRNDLAQLVEEWLPSDVRLIGEKIMPSIGVTEASAHYPILPREAKMKVPSTARAPDGTFTRGDWVWSDDSYTTQEYGYEIPIDNVSQMIYENYIDQERVSAEICKTGLLMAREGRVCAKYLDTGVWTGATKLHTLTNEWDDAANATPFNDIETVSLIIRKKCGLSKRQLTLLITDDNFQFMMHCTEVKNSVQYTEAIAIASPERQKQMLIDYLGIGDIVLIDTLYDAAKLNLGPTITRVWSNEYSFLGIISKGGQSLRERAVARQFNYKKFATDIRFESYDDPTRDATIIRAREYRGEKVMDTDYGCLIDNCKTTVGTDGF